MDAVQHEIVLYFAGWHLSRGDTPNGGEVAGLPWDRVSYINHAFWMTAPADGSTHSSFRQRASGKGARTAFRIVPMNPEADFENQEPSAAVPGLPKNHFAQYAHFARLYPDVNILISIGGWTKCGFFSEMAYTPEGRGSFIASCLELMDAHPWIGGIDIDWEYPAGNPDGERAADPNDPGDEGCPIFGTAAEDRTNFSLLLSEMRSAMDHRYGPGVKKLTACASGSTGWTLPCQDWASAAPSLDLINIMSYDLAGIYNGITGHASSAAQAMDGAEYFRNLGVPPRKICIGSPLYGTLFRMRECPPDPVGAPVEPTRPLPPEKVIDQATIQEWERTEGWHAQYDAEIGAACLYNDDPASPQFRWFLSYESPRSLQAKLDGIRRSGIGGIIVWESAQDTPDSAMITRMHNGLRK